MSEGVSKTGFTPAYNNNVKQLKDGQLFAQANTKAQNAPKQQPTKVYKKPQNNQKPNNRHLEKAGISYVKGFAGGALTAGLLVGGGFAAIAGINSDKPGGGLLGVAMICTAPFAASDAWKDLKNAYDEAGKAYNEHNSK
jgi:predicted lipid-binding transport protein (Tim44 family)